jgi:hypothetical protein
MNFFKKQKKAQEKVYNYFIPASVDTLVNLHNDASILLLKIKYHQKTIEATKDYIEKTKIESSNQKQLVVFQNLVEEKQMLLNSYRKLMTEINKQVNEI